jgi:hypothetical protein
MPVLAAEKQLLGRINLGSHIDGNRHCDVISTGIKLLGNRLVIGHHLIEIGRLVPDDALFCKCLPHLRTPKTPRPSRWGSSW